jgi:hypothetical protein
MRFVLPPSLLGELQAWRASRPPDRVEGAHDAFCLDPGMGPAFFLTSDGRVLVDGTCWDDTPIREASEAEAFASIVVGARKTGLVGLLDLLPAHPDGAPTCTRCHGGRYASLTPDLPPFVCPDCHGLGWTAAP